MHHHKKKKGVNFGADSDDSMSDTISMSSRISGLRSNFSKGNAGASL